MMAWRGAPSSGHSPSTDAANWHPLTWLSHALDYQLFALNPAGHHLDSVLIHALNAVLLFLLLVWVTKRVGPSLLVAALFALHPLNVESVAWVAERKNVLSTLFFFLAIACVCVVCAEAGLAAIYAGCGAVCRGTDGQADGHHAAFCLVAAGLLAAGQNAADGSCRETGWPSRFDGEPRLVLSTLLLEKIPLLFLSAASAWITLKAQRSAMRTVAEFPLPSRIENAVVAYGLYLWKMVWPARLAALYPHSAICLPAWQWILSAIVLVGVTALVVVFRRKRYLPVGWFWFLGTLIPVIGLVQVGDAAMADRYAYIPLIGIFVMIAWGLDDWATAKKGPNGLAVRPGVMRINGAELRH